MTNYGIGIFRKLQTESFVALLSTGLLSAPLAQTLRSMRCRRRNQPIGRGWLAAVAAILGEFSFQVTNTSFQFHYSCNLFRQPSNLTHQKQNEPLRFGIAPGNNPLNSLLRVIGIIELHTYKNTFYGEIRQQGPE